MESFLFNQWTIVIVLCLAAVGITVCWVAVLIAMATALGNKKWLWGISILLLGPVTGIPYAVLNKEAAYPKSLMLRGLIFFVPALLYLVLSQFSHNQ